jgi:hypothetical protein
MQSRTQVLIASSQAGDHSDLRRCSRKMQQPHRPPSTSSGCYGPATDVNDPHGPLCLSMVRRRSNGSMTVTWYLRIEHGKSGSRVYSFTITR